MLVHNASIANIYKRGWYVFCWHIAYFIRYV